MNMTIGMQSTFRSLNAALLAFAVAGCLGLGGCSEPAAETAVVAPAAADPDLIRLDPAAVEAANITVATAETAALEEELRVSGRITVNENATATVGSFTEGVLVECCESVGTRVERGQLLARLHSHEIHDAEAQFWQSRAELQRSQAELEYAQQAHKRASRLYELKAGSLQQVQEAEVKLRGAETAIDFTKAAVERAENHLRFLGLPPEQLPGAAEQHGRETEEAHERRHLIPVRSPIAGTIVERAASQGAVVTPSDPMYVVSNLSRLWVIAQVPEEHLASLRGGMPVEVFVRAYPNRAFPARVTRIADSLDPDTRTVQVRCDLANPRGELKTEMYATLVFRTGTGQPSVVIPLSAVQQVDDADVVFVPADGGQFRARRVETGRQSASKIEILGGLEPGEQLVVEGSFHLKSEMLKGRMIEE